MKWQKTNGQMMDAQDNAATEKYLLSLGYKKIGSEPVEIGEPEQETVEISEAEMPDNLPMGEEQSIGPDDVGEMPKDILDG